MKKLIIKYIVILSVLLYFVGKCLRGKVMENNYITEKATRGENKNQYVRKYLINYINQLKIHFDLNDQEIIEVVKFTLNLYSQKNEGFIKKWWQIWK